MKKFLCITATLMLISSVGCAEKVVSDAPVKTVQLSESSEKNYHLKAISQPEDNLLAMSPIGENGYIMAFGEYYGVPRFYIADSSYNFSAIEIPLDTEENTGFIPKLCPCVDGTVYAAFTKGEHNPNEKSGLMGEFSYLLYHIGTDGSVISQREIKGIGETEIYAIAASENEVYISADTLYKVSTDGTATPVDSKTYGGSIGVDSSGKLCFDYFEEFDTALMIGEKKFPIKNIGDPRSNITHNESYDAVFAVSTGIIGISGDSAVQLTSPLSLGLRENSISEIYPTAEGFLINAFDMNLSQNRLYLITDSVDETAEEQHEQVTLKLGIFSEEDGFLDFIAQQNSSDSYVKIEPVYYTRYDVYDKSEQKQVSTALEQLNIDIISGNSPDMAVFMDTPQYLASKGTFADLYELMDDEMNRDFFLPNVLEACENNGKLYSLPTSFSIASMMCKTKFSPKENQTFDDMLQTLENAPEGIAVDRFNNCYDMFTNMLNFSDFAVKTENGLFNVDAENIRRLMEFCNSLPKEYSELNYETINDEALFMNGKSYSFGDIKSCFDMFGEPVTFAGYPSNNGNGTVLIPSLTVSVLASCENKTAAWDLFKFMYNSTNITNGINSGFPVESEKFYKWAENAESTMTTEEVEQAVKAVTSAKTLGSGIDIDLMKIIWEESDMYFSGEYTAEQAANYIKNRAELYSSERS